MAYVYAAMWFLIGVLLIFRFGRENKIFYPTGVLFLFMGAWWLCDALLPVDLLKGPLSWVFRGVLAVALVLLCLAYYRSRKRDKAQNSTEDRR
jgi:membrane protein implicated in regulation of membrane protease activity